MVTDTYGGIEGLVRYLRKCANRHSEKLDRDTLVQDILVAALKKGIDLNAPWARYWCARGLNMLALIRARYLRDYTPKTNARLHCVAKSERPVGEELEIDDLINHCTAGLSPVRRCHMTLAMQGLTVAEIAQKTRTTKQNVNQSLKVSRRQIRESKRLQELLLGNGDEFHGK